MPRSPVCRRRRYLPHIWTPDAETERRRRLVAGRYQVVRRRTRFKNEVHSILHAQLIPKCPHADLFNARGRAWCPLNSRPTMSEQPSIGTSASLIGLRNIWPCSTKKEIAQDAIEHSAVNRLMAITGVNLAVIVRIIAAIGDIRGSVRSAVRPRTTRSNIWLLTGSISRFGSSRLVCRPVPASDGR